MKVNYLHVVFVLFLLLSGMGVAAQKSEIISTPTYIRTYQHIAVEEMRRTGIPASIKLAQGILESASGNSELARYANNHFGIKCHNDWNGPTFYKDDDKKNECFRKYESAEESYRAHSEFLMKRQRYAFLFQLPPTDYKAWAHGLKQAGYATNPNYAELLIRIIEEHRLYEYDITSPVQAKYEGKQETQKQTTQVFVHNRIRTVLTKEGDTPLKIAKEHNLSLARLLRYNDLQENDFLPANTKIYLQPKRRKNFDVKVHTVKEGETMRDISQQYGVKLHLLYRRNLIHPPDEPAVGETIYINKRRRQAPALRPIYFDLSSPQTGDTPKAAEYIYVVRKGDTLFSIARQFNITVKQIKEWNQLEGDAIRIGDKLKIKKER